MLAISAHSVRAKCPCRRPSRDLPAMLTLSAVRTVPAESDLADLRYLRRLRIFRHVGGRLCRKGEMFASPPNPPSRDMPIPKEMRTMTVGGAGKADSPARRVFGLHRPWRSTNGSHNNRLHNILAGLRHQGRGRQSSAVELHHEGVVAGRVTAFEGVGSRGEFP
jgi:hypothetical protein